VIRSWFEGVTDFSKILMVGFCFANSAFAIQPTLVSIKAEKDGTYTHTYQIKIDNTVMVKGGTTSPDPDFFTIYNFGGLIDDSAKQPDGWTFSTSTNGETPVRGGRTVVNPVDIVGTPNITWNRTGTDLSGPAEIKGFSVRTRVKDIMVGEYSAQVTRKTVGTKSAHPDAEEFKEARIGSISTPQLPKTPGATR
jgi:hypothetical protein